MFERLEHVSMEMVEEELMGNGEDTNAGSDHFGLGCLYMAVTGKP